jgi:putative oxidoreductase
MLSAIFVVQGSEAVLDPEKLAARAKPVTDRVAPALQRIHPKMPTEPRAIIQANGAVQVTAGLLMLTPLRRPAAVALAASLVPTTLAAHAFWQVADPADRKRQRIQFLKNVGLLGGLMLAALDTEGRPGLRWRAGHLAHTTSDSVRRTARTTQSKAKIARRAAAMGRHLPG